jgi:hypothetical protein
VIYKFTFRDNPAHIYCALMQLDFIRIHSYTPLTLQLEEAKLQKKPHSTEVIFSARLKFV